MKTFIRYPGNKSRHLKHILPHIPTDFKTYIEPFVGSGALFLSLKPRKWIINDKNTDLIILWNLVNDNPRYIIDFIRKFYTYFQTKLKTNEERLLYCRKKTEQLNNLDPSFKKSCTILVLTFCVYMGTLINKDRFYFNGLDNKIYYNKSLFFIKQEYFDRLLKAHRYLQESNGKIMNEDFKQVLSKAKKGDFVFLDPPYQEDHRYNFQYNINDRSESNIKFVDELKEELRILDRKGIKWLMTQADTEQIRKKYKEYSIISFPVYRLNNRTYKKELIIKNF